MADHSGFVMHYSYDDIGRLVRLSDQNDADLVRYIYDAAGQLSRKNHGNGTFSTYEYDPAGRLQHLVHHAPDGSINSRFDYSYNALGRPISMATLDGTWSYEYDPIGQLIHAEFDSNNPAIADQDLSYEYDAMGNRVRAIENGVVTLYRTNSLNQYTAVGSAAYAYDADGNLSSITGVTTRTFTFDEINRLIGVTVGGLTSSYEYNALNHRIAATHDGVRTEYLNDPTGIVQLFAEFHATGGAVAHYAYGIGLESRIDASGDVAAYDFDALGSTVGLTNSAGGYANHYSYTPFGERIVHAETLANPFKYVGRFGVMSDHDDLYYSRARYYMPVDGRFASADPIGILGGMNVNRYVKNRPTDRMDPTGLNPQATALLAAAQRFTSIAIWEAVMAETGGMVAAAASSTEVVATTATLTNSAAAVGGTTTSVAVPTIASGSAVSTTAVSSAVTSTASGAGAGSAGAATVGTTVAGVAAAALAGLAIGTLINEFTDAGDLGFAICSLSNCDAPDPEIFGDLGAGTAGSGFAVTSIDPNAKTCTAGFGPSNFIAAANLLTYRVDFENDATATAPTQRVDIADQLSDQLDWTSLQFTEVAFADQFIAIPAGSQFFQTIVDMNIDGTEFQVAVELDFNSDTGLVTAQFQSLDPATGLPPDALTGFLLPEDGTGRGQGHFNFTIRPLADLASGTEIRNVAIIQFDFQEIIATNQVDPHDPLQGVDLNKEALVTIDAAAPTSSIEPLPPTTDSESFTVNWSGDDDAGGSGIAAFDVFVSDNGGAFVPFLLGTTSRSATFHGEFGHTYSFYSEAIDNVGHRETRDTAQAATTLEAPEQTSGPRISDVRLHTRGGRVLGILISFDREVDRTEAERIANYRLVSRGKDKVFGTPDDAVLAIASATYDISRNRVELKMAKKLRTNRELELTVRDTVTDPNGTRLDGDGDGNAGGDFVIRGGPWTQRLRGTSTDLVFRYPSRAAHAPAIDTAIAALIERGQGRLLSSPRELDEVIDQFSVFERPSNVKSRR